ncbi:hypothetical protein ANAPH2_01198 [Anaplasma phagocytophilum]|nr:hypothetical protein ANAPH2_01198 [Anaplasma phagocytophilum]
MYKKVSMAKNRKYDKTSPLAIPKIDPETLSNKLCLKGDNIRIIIPFTRITQAIEPMNTVTLENTSARVSERTRAPYISEK